MSKMDAEYWREKKREQRAAAKEEAEKEERAKRKYNEDGLLVFFKQRCEACGVEWRASIEIPCVYCDGKGNRKAQDTRWAPVKQLEPISD